MNERIQRAILGVSDGVTSIAGIIAGGHAAHVSNIHLGKTALAGAAAAVVSMAGAELNAEGKTDWGAIGAMGVGTLYGAALPAVPLLLVAGNAVLPIVAGLAIMVAVSAGELRYRMTNRAKNRWVAYARVLAVLLVGGIVGYVAGRV